MKFNLKIILLVLLFLTTLVAKEPSQINTTNIKYSDKITLQLQWKHQFEFAGFYAAKEKGFYKEVGLDVEFKEFKSNMNIVGEVIKENAQYGLSYSTIIEDYMRGDPIVFVANFFKQSPLVLVTQKEIHTPLELKGKKIMGLLDSSHKQIILTMLDKFNLKLHDFQNVPRKFSVESFINKEVDAISVFTTNEIYTLDKLGAKYNILDPAAFGTKFYDINLFTTRSELQNNPERVERFREASIRGWEYALKNKQEIVDLILKKYNTQNKTKEALLFEANQIEYLMLPNIYPIGSIDIQRVSLIADSFSQSSNIPKESNKKLENFIYKSKKNTLIFNNEEKNYLKNKKLLKMCVDPNWMPLEKIEDGKHIGFAADFIKLVAQKIDIPLELVTTTKWTQSLNKIKNKECDILALAHKTPSREKYLDFTTPILKIPLVVATKNGVPFSDSFNNIKDKPLAIVENYSFYELLTNKYKNLNLTQVPSIQEGLSLVKQEKVFGLLDNTIVINNEIRKNNLTDFVSISGQFQENFQLSIASRDDEPILNDILEKTILSIDSKTKEDILNKWSNINYQIKTDYKVLWQLLFFSLVLISVFIYWNLKLKEEIRNKELVQKELQISEERFRTLFDIAPVLIDSFDKNGKVILWNKECERVFGWSKKEIQSSKNPLDLFYPDPKTQEKLINSVAKNEHNFYQQWNPKTKSGKTINTMWANVNLPNDEVIHIGYDITQQRENEKLINEKTEQLRVAKKELEELNSTLEHRIEAEIEKNTKQQVILMQQSKLAQMGEMIENIAHQWRQPLAQINSSVLLVDIALTKHNIDDNMIEDKLLEIESLTEYMSKTIDDFKNFFNPDKKKTFFTIDEAITKAYDILKGSLKINHIEVDINIPHKLECNSHLEELQQVILTLLNNAIDALLSNKISKGKIVINAFQEEQDIVITVQDNALGISEDFITKIFEPYFTTKHKTQGTGLGLYMAKMITQSGLSGTLDVENKNQGACFKIQIPQGKV